MERAKDLPKAFSHDGITLKLSHTAHLVGWWKHYFFILMNKKKRRFQEWQRWSTWPVTISHVIIEKQRSVNLLPADKAQLCKEFFQRTTSLWCLPQGLQAGRWWWPTHQQRRDWRWNSWSRCACAGFSKLQNKLKKRHNQQPPEQGAELHCAQITWQFQVIHNWQIHIMV